MSRIKTLIEELGDDAPPLRVIFGDTSKPVDKDLLKDDEDTEKSAG